MACGFPVSFTTGWVREMRPLLIPCKLSLKDRSHGFLHLVSAIATSFFIYGRSLGLLDLGPFRQSRDDLVLSDVARAPAALL